LVVDFNGDFFSDTDECGGDSLDGGGAGVCGSGAGAGERADMSAWLARPKHAQNIWARRSANP
jgi:hypothetical protein